MKREELALKIKRRRNVVTQGRKSRQNQRGSWNAEIEKTDPYHPSLIHVVTINGFQVLLSSITCLSSYPIGRRYLPYSSSPPTQYMCLIQSANDPQDPQSHSLYPGYKSGLKTAAQCQFSPELACCSNSVSHSHKL